MINGRKLSFLEFLSDIRLVLTSPARRFDLIKERGAAWGSLVLLVVPLYFGFSYMGGVYFDRDPFPGYSFIPPLVIAAVAVFLKLFFIHVVARMFRPQESPEQGRGTLSGLFVDAAMAAMGRADVFEAKIAWGGQTSSSALKTFFLTSKSSKTASMTRSAPLAS